MKRSALMSSPPFAAISRQHLAIPPFVRIISSRNKRRFHYRSIRQGVEQYVSIPVATVGRITEPWLAEELIANGKADICMMGRANLCNPDFVSEAQSGREDDIRPCIGCLRCLNGIMFGKRVSCTVNPSLEPDNEDTIVPAEVKKNVLIFGGGPTGKRRAI